MNEKKLRIFELLLLLSISFLPSIIFSIWSLTSQTSITDYFPYKIPNFLSQIIESLLSIILMFYVLSRRQKNISSIGVHPNLSLIDVFHSIAIIIAFSLIHSLSASLLSNIDTEFVFQDSHPKNTEILQTKYTFLLIVLAIVSPLQEDLLIRGYTMTQIFDITENKFFTVSASVTLQFIYHLGEGLPHDLMSTPFYLITSLYFIKFGNLNPVIIAHLLLNLSLLSRL